MASLDLNVHIHSIFNGFAQKLFLHYIHNDKDLRLHIPRSFYDQFVIYFDI